MSLPSFNEHDGHAKLSPLTGPSKPAPSVVSWLSRVTDGRDRSSLRVLDLGCGKGGTVAWLLEQGFDAYGMDVRAEYVDNGRAYLGADRLAVLDRGSYPYPDDHFDIVISNQVFEHVADLGELAREVARTTKPGGLGLHIFPARWVFTEPHMHTPIVHWLPKGGIRRLGIKLALGAGWAAPYFVERTLDERTEIFSQYSDNETFYRAPRLIRRVLEAAGLSVDFTEASRDRLLSKLGTRRRLPGPVDRVAVWAYRNTRMMCLTTVKV
ncbi:methyltransferase domain-containing protein [Mycolicibacterium sp. PAM1]|uniref:class I SAM-dependent methyltransferase n=1 Tax=Mycolicibacterium sp. PAM1 TaxID=2853535 RepID=UPI001C3D9B8B|nr:class I SAM-dependent methyltransferase [Mycolicibacterium sp. PAM1]MBV5245382.1 methyltransferase domain-containing protein [Mycolicibacterium sp. PAM1]